MNVKKNFTWNDIEKIIKIMQVKTHPKMGLSQRKLCLEAGLDIANSQTRKIISYLKDSGCLKSLGFIGAAELVHVNKIKVSDLLDEQEKVNFLISNYIGDIHLFQWRPGFK